MTKIEPVDVTCPNCGASGVYDRYASANVTLNPSLKDRVMDGSLFVYECPNCGNKLRVVTSCLYHDMRKRLLIQLSPEVEDDAELRDMLDTLTENGVNLSFTDEGYEVKVVADLNDLKEKIAIADDGLDDRLVEIVKIYARILASSEEGASEFDDVRYIGLDDDGIKIGILFNGECLATAVVPMSLYEEQKAEHPLTSRSEEDSYIVDYVWAYEVMGLGKETE
ncbi:MAG: CpXC domain-containing protein [Eggerthellaceae bacterium]